VSKNFERWKELASLTSKEQDPRRLTELASEMNLVLTQKTPHLDPPLHAPAARSQEESRTEFLRCSTAEVSNYEQTRARELS